MSGLIRAARTRMSARGKVIGASIAGAFVLLLIIGGIGISGYFGPRGTTRRAIRLYEHGRREAAQAVFTRLANDYPQLPVPRVYLGRIARETRRYDVAKRELEAAIQLDPNSAAAMREMGSLMFVTGRFDVAERFYRRAVARDPADRLAQGYLGCSLVRLGRATEAQEPLIRAGNGPWSSCR
jgi:tetratricopeptide (TPR) repeat protein